ncbi:MAG: adenylate/guanylate cyclase domain-containing protein [Proteobacteria bacterium]|nr:adenylate/guanylate cyclase domain-containing protein [Pseudomonadota bacterium]
MADPNLYLFGAIAFVLLVTLVSFRSQVASLVNEQLTRVKHNENKLLEVTTAMSAEIQLQPLLIKVMETVNDILNADRCTIFLHDPDSSELWSKVASGLETKEIRFPDHLGIAGTVFTSGEIINIKDAYADDRFNKAVDRKTGYRTRSILCMQITNKMGTAIGVIQVLNKESGTFDSTDEQRLRAFCSQAAVAIENAKLFDEVVTIKNYNEAMLESMSTGILSTNADKKIVKVNTSACKLLWYDSDEDILGKNITEVFQDDNQWIADAIDQVLRIGTYDEALDATIILDPARKGDSLAEEFDQFKLSVNLKLQPLTDIHNKRIGCLMIFEDITSEKRLKSTMARYMPKELADKLLEEGEQALGGSIQDATILFSDIRSFTSFSERNGPQETVSMLNDYFGVMYEQIINNEGILDKYIGDAIMAVFGAPFPGPQDSDNALTTAIQMMDALRKFNRDRLKAGKDLIEIGIGISTDEVVSGNIGSSKRMDYTVIGDGVNLAARLEGATKHYKSYVLISDKTVRTLKKEYLLREVDRIRVKGKEEPVAIYEAIDALSSHDRERAAETLDLFNQALDAYKDRRWSQAKSQFSEIVDLRSNDEVSKLYIDRCNHFISSPPPPEWDGVWTMKTK